MNLTQKLQLKLIKTKMKALKQKYKQLKKSCKPDVQLGTQGDVWHIKIDQKKGIILLSRTFNGKQMESYRPYTTRQTPVVLAAITQGYQPPRHLVDLDKPTD